MILKSSLCLAIGIFNSKSKVFKGLFITFAINLKEFKLVNLGGRLFKPIPAMNFGQKQIPP
jgi:hypothetical protein